MSWKMASKILVDYESSSDDDQQTLETTIKRIRTVEHIPGNWATLIYIPIVSDNLEKWIISIFEKIKLKNPTLQKLEDMDGNIHISLCRTAYLKEYQIDRFVQSVTSKVNSFDFMNDLSQISFSKVSIYQNDEKTRSFAAVDVHAGATALKWMVEQLNPILLEFNQQSFYSDPKFHASFGWTTFDIRLPHFSPDELTSLHKICCFISRIHIRVGNRVIQLDLPTS